MNTHNNLTEKRLLYLILGIVLLNLLLKQCRSHSTSETNSPKISSVRDTVWQTKIDTFKVQTLTYKTVYVNKDDVSEITEDRSKGIDTATQTEAKIYRDTLQNDDIDIFSYSLVEGNLLDSDISFKLKVPREITVTKTIEHPKTYRSGLFLFSEVGGNANQLDNLSLGVQYNRKGKWFVSYRANLNQFNQTTHNVGVGIRLIK